MTTSEWRSVRAEKLVEFIEELLVAERRVTVERIREAVQVAWVGYYNSQPTQSLNAILDEEAAR